MSDDEKESPKSSVTERNWILWLTAVVLGAFLIFEFINFLGEPDEAATAAANPPPAAASVAIPAAPASAAPAAESAAPAASAAPADSAKAP